MKKLIIASLVITMLTTSTNFVKAISISDTYYEYQDYLSAVDGDPESLDYSGDGIVVAVIDSGVWQSHPDLSGAIWNNYYDTPNDGIDNDGNGYIDDYYGWNFVDENSNMEVTHSHGTAVAGIIAAQIDRWGIVGIAPDVKIMSLIACGTYSCYENDVFEAIYYAVANGAQVINLSLGYDNGYLGYSQNYNDVIEYAYNNGVVVVVSAGNGDMESAGSLGLNLDYTPVSPVCNDVDNTNMVLGVGASDASWSNYGNCVDVVAPGVDIIVDSVPAYSNGYYFDYMDGTSFSAPMVSAAAALILDKRDYYTNIDIIDRIISTTDDGVLDIEAALSQNLSIDFDDISSEDVYAGDQVIFYGEHFSPRYSVKLIGGGRSQTVDDVKFLDSTIMIVTLPNDLETDEYYVSFDNYDARSDEFDVTAIESSTTTIDNYNDGDDDTDTEIASDSSIDTSDTATNTLYSALAERLAGYILLQVQQHGEAWYVNPTDYLRYYMKDGDVAYEMMRSFALGITDADLEIIPSVDNQEEILSSSSICLSNSLANRLRGRILLQVEQHGEAWYVHPDTCRRIYMKDGDAAYTIMRYLSLGITDVDLETINTGEME